MAIKIGKIAKATKGLAGKIPTGLKVAGLGAAAYGLGKAIGSIKTKREREKMADGTVRKNRKTEGQVGNTRFQIDKTKVKNPSEGQKTKTTKVKIETPTKRLTVSKTKGQKATYKYEKG